MSEERLEAIANAVKQMAAKQAVLHDTVASLLAEIANLAPDAERKLEAMISSEEGAAFEALGATNLADPAMNDLQRDKEDYRLQLFRQARAALPRITSRSN